MFITDSYVRVRSNDLHYIRTRLPQNLMVASRKHLVNVLDRVAAQQGYEVGRSFVLPTTFRGGEEHMETLYRHCIESMRVHGTAWYYFHVLQYLCVQVTGIPTGFFTMTANPRDKDMLAEGSIDPTDGSLNTDIVNRLFKLKTDVFKTDLIEKKIMGNVRNMIKVVEFQKRGLPHIHMVLTLDRKVCIFFCDYAEKILSGQ
jgi:Helitron helicase-like domain at N-terminus